MRDPGLVPCFRPREFRRAERNAGSGRTRRHVPRRRGHQPRRRDHVPAVAGRADHQSRDRQRRFADHHGGHCRAIPDLRFEPRPGVFGRLDPDRHHRRPDRHGRRADPRHLLHGARAASTVDPVSQARDAARHDAGGSLAPAAQAQHRGRHSSDFCQFAFAAAAGLAEEMYAIDSKEEENLPENKWLKHFDLVDEELSLVDEHKNLVDTQGRKINEFGHYINEKGNRIDINGNLLDEDGNYKITAKYSKKEEKKKPTRRRTTKKKTKTLDATES